MLNAIHFINAVKPITILIVGEYGLSTDLQTLQIDSPRNSGINNFFIYLSNFKEFFYSPEEVEQKKTESELLVEYVDYKPWRAAKV